MSTKTSQRQKKRERRKATLTASEPSTASEQPQPAAEDPMDLASEDGTQCNMDTVSAENEATASIETTPMASHEAQEKPLESLNLLLHRTDGESNE
ncbi:hypothetical protein N7540_003348 [Penicillium herquei]|nr:hypothetical protein N7540_003348 [Penicillium herquei]